jgi:hypothetical protein
MADKRISDLTALTGANVADTDLLPIVDTSATETKKITFGEFKTALDTATGFVRITGDTMTGALDVQSTITADGLTLGVYDSFFVSTPLNVKSDASHFGLSFQENSGNESWQIGVNANGDLSFHNSADATPSVRFDDAGTVDISGDIDVDGTTNLDVVDIDGATQIDATVTVGVDDTGYDVKFFGATAGAYMLWDESADDLILGGAAGLSVNSTALVTGVLTTTAATVHTGGITMPNNAKAIFGAGSDLQIYHTGTYSLIADTSGTGPLRVVTNTFQLNNAADTQNMIAAAEGGAVTLYNAGNAKLATTATGIDVTGVITTDGMTTSANINFGDNDKAIFGAGSSLQIFSDSTDSFINESGIGHLYIQATNLRFKSLAGENFMALNEDGAVTSYYNNALKLATTATGIDVTGTVVADGLTVEGASAGGTYITSSSGSAAGDVKIEHIINSGRNLNTINSESGSGSAIALAFSTGETKRLNIASNGDINFYATDGTTQAFHWDATDEALGIGDTNPVNGYLTIRGASTSGTINSHIMLTGDGAIVGEGPQIVFSESGTASNWVGASIGFERTGGGGIGNFIFRTRRSTGDANTLATEAMRIDSNGDISFYEDTGTTPKMVWKAADERLGIGTSSPAEKLDVVGNIKASGTATVGGIYNSSLYNQSAGNIAFWVPNVGEACTIQQNTGHVEVTTGNLIIGTAGKGIDFDPAGGGAANLLDDYEEGTFEPTVRGSTTVGSATYTVQQGSYTKIGNVVYWQVRLAYTGHTGTGNMQIPFPFTSSNRYAAGNYSYRDALTVPASEDLKVYIPPSATYIGLYSVALGTDSVVALVLDTAVTDLSISGVCTVV